jgi:hypothetical protein
MSDIQKKVDEVMGSVDNIQRAMPNPFFYTRLEARMTASKMNSWEKLSRLVSRPAIAAVTLSLVLIINALVLVEGISALDNVPDLSEMASAEDLRPTSYYDIENAQP